MEKNTASGFLRLCFDGNKFDRADQAGFGRGLRGAKAAHKTGYCRQYMRSGKFQTVSACLPDPPPMFSAVQENYFD